MASAPTDQKWSCLANASFLPLGDQLGATPPPSVPRDLPSETLTSPIFGSPLNRSFV